MKETVVFPTADEIARHRKMQTVICATAVSRTGKHDAHPNEDRFILNLGIQDEKYGVMHVLCVVDGHGGSHACTYVESNIVSVLREQMKNNSNDMEKVCEEAFRVINKHILYDGFIAQRDCSGCCISLVIIVGCVAFIASAGDCRILLVQGGKVLYKSKLHTGSNKSEIQRIHAAGGYFTNKRVFGLLAPTRGFGDADIRAQHLSCLGENVSLSTRSDREYTTSLMNNLHPLHMIPSPHPATQTILLSPPPFFAADEQRKGDASRKRKEGPSGNDEEEDVDVSQQPLAIVIHSDGIGDVLNSKRLAKIVHSRLKQDEDGEEDEEGRKEAKNGKKKSKKMSFEEIARRCWSGVRDWTMVSGLYSCWNENNDQSNNNNNNNKNTVNNDNNKTSNGTFILNPGLDFELLEEVQQMQPTSFLRKAHEMGERLGAATLEIVDEAYNTPPNRDDVTCVLCEIRLLPSDAASKGDCEGSSVLVVGEGRGWSEWSVAQEEEQEEEENEEDENEEQNEEDEEKRKGSQHKRQKGGQSRSQPPPKHNHGRSHNHNHNHHQHGF